MLAVLIKIWKRMDYICGKRLQPALAEIVTGLERHNELSCSRETRAKLLKISVATIDRLLRPERHKYELRSRSRTRPGTLLKHQIPIRTFSDWDEQRPGFAVPQDRLPCIALAFALLRCANHGHSLHSSQLKY